MANGNGVNVRFQWSEWANGLVAAFISGGATAVGTLNIAFGVTGSWRQTWLIAGGSFLSAGLTAFFAYLAKHPVPTWDGKPGSSTDRRTEMRNTTPATVTVNVPVADAKSDSKV